MPNIYTRDALWVDGRRVERQTQSAEFFQLVGATRFELAVAGGIAVQATRTVMVPCPPGVKNSGAYLNNYGLDPKSTPLTLAAWLEDSRLANGVAPRAVAIPEQIRPFVALAWEHAELVFYACTLDRGGPGDHCYDCARRGEVVTIRLYRAGKDLDWVAPGPELRARYFIGID